MKGSKLYNTNPALNQWEEQQYKKLMAKKIKGAKSTLAGHSGPRHTNCKPGAATGKVTTNLSSIPSTDSSSSKHGSLMQPNSSNAASAPGAGTADVLLKIQELLQTPLLQQLVQQKQQQLSCGASQAAPPTITAAPTSAYPAAGAPAQKPLAGLQGATSLQGAAQHNHALHGIHSGLQSHAPVASMQQELLQQQQQLTATAQPWVLPVAATPEPAATSSPEPFAAPAGHTTAAAAVAAAVSVGSISTLTPEQLIWLASTATALLQGSTMGSIPADFGDSGCGLGTLQAGRPSSDSSNCQDAAAAGYSSSSGTAAGSRCSSRETSRQAAAAAGRQAGRVRSAAGRRQQQQQQQRRQRPAWDEQWHCSDDSSSTAGATNAAAGAAVTAATATSAAKAPPSRVHSGHMKPPKPGRQVAARSARRQTEQGVSEGRNAAAAGDDGNIDAVAGMRLQSLPGGGRQAAAHAAAQATAAEPGSNAGRQGVKGNSSTNARKTNSHCRALPVNPPQPEAAAAAASKRSSSGPGGTTDTSSSTPAAAASGAAVASLSEPGTCSPGVAAAVAAANARLRSLSGAGSSSSSSSRNGRGLANTGSSCGGGSRKVLLHAASCNAGSLTSGPSSSSHGAASRYSNSDADDEAAECLEDSQGKQKGIAMQAAAVLGGCSSAAGCESGAELEAWQSSSSNRGSSSCCASSQRRNTAAAAAALGQTALDVLATSLMQLNSMIQHKAQELSQQQQQQQHALDLHAKHAAAGVSAGNGTTTGQAAAAASLWSAPSELMGCSMQLQHSELLVLPMGGTPLLGMSDLAFLELGQDVPADSASAATCYSSGGCVLDEGGAGAVSDVQQQQQQSRGGSSSGGRSSVLSQQAASAATAAAAAALEENDMVLLGTLQGSFSMAAITQQLTAASVSNVSTAAGQTQFGTRNVRQAGQQQQCAEAATTAIVARQTNVMDTELLSSAEGGGVTALKLVGHDDGGVVEVFEVLEYGLASSDCEDDCQDEVHSGGYEVHGGDAHNADEGWEVGEDGEQQQQQPQPQQQPQLVFSGPPQDVEERQQQLQQQQQVTMQSSLELQQQAHLLEQGLVQLQLLVESSRTQL